MNVLPRWAVLAIDMFLIFLGYILAVLVRLNFNLVAADRWLSYQPVIAYCAVNFVALLIFKPYLGVIRFTHKEDIAAVVKALITSAFVLAALNFYVRENYPTERVVPFSIVIIGALVNFALLLGYRFAVRDIYESAVAKLANRKRVAIFGAGFTGRLAAQAMLNTNSMYSLELFLDDDPTLEQSKIYGKTVINPQSSLAKTLGSVKVDELLIAVQQLSQERRNWIIEECLELGIQVKEVPDLNKWVGGQLSEKQFKDIRIEDLLGRSPIRIASKNAVDAFSGQVVLVTGAAGSIGSEISRQLVKCGVLKLILVDKAESDLYELHQNLLNEFPQIDQVEIYICDITKKRAISEVFLQHRPNVILHAAAYKHVPMLEHQPLEGIWANIVGTKTVADLASENGVDKFIMISTDKAVNPTSIMGATKRAAEIYTQVLNDNSSTTYVTTRFGNVLGSHGSVIPLITQQIQNGGPVTVTHPEVTRYFMTIPEACSLVLEAGAMGNEGELFLFDMGEPVKILDLARKMIKLAGLEEGKDIEIKFTGLRPGEKLFEEMLLDLEGLKPTYHQKIKIADVISNDFEQVNLIIRSLCESLDQRDEMECVRKLKQLVPEYKSRMSRFEILDN